MAERRSRRPRATSAPAAPERRWYRMDLHLHSPASADWQEPGISYLDWLLQAEARGLDIVAMTDHNTVAGVRALRQEIQQLLWLEEHNRLRPQEKRTLDEFKRLADKILVLPGFEFTAMLGFHILGIFASETSVRRLENILMRLNVPEDKLDAGSTEVGATADVLSAYRLIREAGGLAIAAHINSSHGVFMQGINFGGQTRIAYTQDPSLHALEVTDLESRSLRATIKFFNGTKPEYARRMHCIQGSDAHRLVRSQREQERLGIGERATEVLLPEPSFDALYALFQTEDFARTRPSRPQDRPTDIVLAARSQGASASQSFHETLTRQGGNLFQVLADICAFANTDGGTLYIGVPDSPRGAPVGVENVPDTIAFLTGECSKQLVPSLNVGIDALESQGQQVLRVTVPAGRTKPYVIDQSKIYIRQDAESVLANRDQMIRLVQQGLTTTQPRPQPVVPPAPTQPAPAPAASAVESGRSRFRRSSRPLVPGVHPTLSGNGAEASEQAVEVPGFRAEAPTEDAIGESVLAAVEDDAAEEAETALLPEDVALPAPASKRPDTSRNFSVPPPSVGVEIIESFVRKGNRYHSIKDLRNNQVVQNVTRNSARKLWQYAISQAENNPARPDKCQWIGDIGLFQTATRAQKQRYDLVQRDKFGRIHTYYGVTQEGMEGPWRAFLTGADLAPAPTGQPLDSVDDLFEDVISEPTALALDDIAASEPLSGVSGIADADFADRVSLPVETEQEGIGADDRRRPEAEGGSALRWTMDAEDVRLRYTPEPADVLAYAEEAGSDVRGEAVTTSEETMVELAPEVELVPEFVAAQQPAVETAETSGVPPTENALIPEWVAGEQALTETDSLGPTADAPDVELSDDEGEGDSTFSEPTGKSRSRNRNWTQRRRAVQARVEKTVDGGALPEQHEPEPNVSSDEVAALADSGDGATADDGRRSAKPTRRGTADDGQVALSADATQTAREETGVSPDTVAGMADQPAVTETPVAAKPKRARSKSGASAASSASGRRKKTPKAEMTASEESVSTLGEPVTIELD